MACKACESCNDKQVFYQVEQDDGEYYIEDRGGSWSLITPTDSNILNSETNPSFEVNTNNWTGGNQSTAEAYSGAYSYHFTSQIRETATIWLATGTRCVSAMVKTCCGAKIKIGISDNNITGNYKYFNEFTGTGCWQQIYFCQSQNYGAGLLPDFLKINVEGCTDNYIDLVTWVNNVTDPVVPFDGDSLGGGFTGTPHASSSILFGGNKFGGSRVRLFEDLGFRTIAYSGHGVPPVNLPTTQYARRPGARTQRATALSRNIIITGEICGCSWRELSQKKLALINALNLNLDGTCSSNRTLTLQYDCLDECGDTVGEPVRIEANYTGGLDGQRTTPFCERISLSFQGNKDPMFYSGRQHCKVIPPNTPVTVTNSGNASAQVTLYARNRGTMTLTSITNQTTGGKVEFGTSGYTVPANTDAIFRNQFGNTSFRLSNLAYINDQLTVSNGSKPSQFNLQKGDNVIQIAGSASGADSEFVLCWRERYLSTESACADCS